MWNPLSWVMEAAAIMAIAIPHGKVKNMNIHVFALPYKIKSKFIRAYDT